MSRRCGRWRVWPSSIKRSYSRLNGSVVATCRSSPATNRSHAVEKGVSSSAGRVRYDARLIHTNLWRTRSRSNFLQRLDCLGNQAGTPSGAQVAEVRLRHGRLPTNGVVTSRTRRIPPSRYQPVQRCTVERAAASRLEGSVALTPSRDLTSGNATWTVVVLAETVFETFSQRPEFCFGLFFLPQ
jgi:hypothetical protein